MSLMIFLLISFPSQQFFFTLFQLVFILSKHNLSLGLESSGIQGSFFFF